MTKKSFYLFIRKILGLDTTIYDEVVPYEVDIDKPPVPPPNRILKGLFLDETSISIRQREEWQKYMYARSEARDERIKEIMSKLRI